MTVLWQQPWDVEEWHADDPLGYPHAVAPPGPHTDYGAVLAVLQTAARWPFFYRLNHVAQLATTRFGVCLDAGHSRLAHLLGTTCVAAELLRHIEETEPLDHTERAAVLLHAFLHDAFHGPLGHVLDGIAPVFLPVQYGKPQALRKPDKAMLHEAVQGAGRLSADGDPPPVIEIRRLVNEVARVQLPLINTEGSRLDISVGEHADAIFKVLEELTASTALNAERKFLRDVMDADIDADRLDFIWRDYHQLHQQNLSPDVDRIMKSVRVEADGDRRVLRFNDHRTVRTFLETRRELYRNAYENQRKLAIDVLVERAVIRTLQRHECVSEDLLLSGKLTAAEQEEIRWRLFLLSDQHLIGLLSELSISPTMHDVRALVEDVLLNRAWTPVVEKAIQLGEIQNVVKRRGLRADFAAKVAAARRERTGAAKMGEDELNSWHEVSLKAYESDQALRDFLDSEGVVYAPDEDGVLPGFGDSDIIYDLHMDLGNELSATFRFERALWNACREKKQFVEHLGRFGRRRHVDESALEFPWLFVHAHPLPQRDPVAVARSHMKEASDGGALTKRQQTATSGDPFELSDRTTVGVFPLYFFAPPYLAGNPEALAVMKATIETFLLERRWFG